MFVSVTVSKVHKFVITEIIYNSPVLCTQCEYARAKSQHFLEHAVPPPPPQRLSTFMVIPQSEGLKHMTGHKPSKVPHL
jgi:hypothetical protein